MYEMITYEDILRRMLERIPNNLDKREGSVIYNALAPAAVELQNMYIELDVILDESFADTQSRDYLIKRCAERGIKPEAATRAVLKGEFNMNIPIGARFSLDRLNYIVTEKLEDCIYKLQCETYGEEGNRYFGTLIPIDYIQGLTMANLTEILIPGEDEETTEHLRSRYFGSLDTKAFGGNIADYKEKTNALEGVGGVKVYPAPDQIGGTVRLVIIDSAYGKPSEVLIEKVQTEVDPVRNHGEGFGFAPIGHVVTVQGVQEKRIDVSLQLTCQEGWIWEDVSGYVKDCIEEYFLELRKAWDSSDRIVIRISQIESRILELQGILDITGTMLNQLSENLVLESNEIPVRGEIIG